MSELKEFESYIALCLAAGDVIYRYEDKEDLYHIVLETDYDHEFYKNGIEYTLEGFLLEVPKELAEILVFNFDKLVK